MSRLITYLLLLLLPGSTTAENLFHIKSNANPTHLVELYTSEGCSSCPPADRWFTQLRSNSRLWKSFIPIGFHVDYWNKLGWFDRFSRKKFSNRQRSYANSWQSNRVYTPGFILNGKEWKNQSIKSLKPKSGNLVGILEAEKIATRQFKIKFSPLKPLDKLNVVGALLGNGLTTNVRSGENSGRTLKHDFVVLELEKSSLKKNGTTYTAKINFSKKPKLKEGIEPESFSVAFWVVQPSVHPLAPIQAVGGDL